MNEPSAISFVRLDFMTVKPYLKSILILLVAVSLFMILFSGEGVISITVCMMFAILFAIYPFAIGEKNNIDALYPTLSIKRKTVVSGRYLFALAIDIFVGLLACLFTFAVLMIMQKDFNVLESLASIFVVFLIFSILQAVQLPIFFKLGYTKAKFLAYLPLIGLPLAISTFAFLGILAFSNQAARFFEWIETNPFMVVLFAVAVWFLTMFISYKTSLSYYSKRDF